MVKTYILRRYSIDELDDILYNKLNIQSRNLKNYNDKSLSFFMNSVVNSITNTILEELTDGWVEDSPVSEDDLYEFIKRIFENRIKDRYMELTDIGLRENIQRIQEMMGIIVEDNDRRIPLVLNLFNEVFDNLDLVRTYEDIIQCDFVDKKTGKKVFERNNWGTFWIYDCEIFDHLRVLITSFLRFDKDDEFERLLIVYLNKRYKKEFESRPIRVIDTEGCE